MLTISDEQADYAVKVKQQVEAAGLSVTLDDSSETIGKKIRAAETDKVPVVLVVGKREVESGVKEARVRKDLNKEQKIEAKSLEGLIKVLVDGAEKKEKEF